MKNLLKKLQAETYITLVKTHGYHWNVRGPNFSQLHDLFQNQYEEMFIAVDDIAERVRAVGDLAPGSFDKFVQISEVEESEEDNITAEEMLESLIKAHEQIVETAKKLDARATEVGDNKTADLAIERIGVHEKKIWMLKSTLS